MEQLAARRAELYEAYDEAALRILMDRYADRCGERFMEAASEREPGEGPSPALDGRIAAALEGCARRRRASLRKKRLLYLGSRAAIILLAVTAALALTSPFPAHGQDAPPPAVTETAPPAAETEPPAAPAGEAQTEIPG
jgi:hypothetical protein